jgi:hypothetical protein
VDSNANESTKFSEMYNKMAKMEEDYKKKLADVEKVKEKEIKQYKESLEHNYNKLTDMSMINLRKDITNKDFEHNSNTSKLKSDLDQSKSDNKILEKELMFMYKLIKTISSEQYQANSILFNKELDDKLRPENLPSMFSLLEKKSVTNFLSYKKVSLNEFEKNMPSRPLTAKSITSNMSGFTSQLKFDFSKTNSRIGIDSRTMGQSQTRLGNMHYGQGTRPLTGRDSRPTTREKSPKGINSSKNQFNRCDSARSILPRSNLASAKNLASMDNLF